MSCEREISFTCPKCGKDHPFVIWKSINTTLDPEMKAKVKDRSAFLFECPSCGEKTYVDYGLLYHQMEDRIMIDYAVSDESAEEFIRSLNEEDPTGLLADIKKGYLNRIVRSQNELIEKIAIFDEGLDDRIIEVFKIYVLYKFHNENPNCEDIEILYFRDQNKNCVQVIADGKNQAVAEISAEFYEELCQEYKDKIPDIRDDGPCIDRNWALQLMGLN